MDVVMARVTGRLSMVYHRLACAIRLVYWNNEHGFADETAIVFPVQLVYLADATSRALLGKLAWSCTDKKHGPADVTSMVLLGQLRLSCWGS